MGWVREGVGKGKGPCREFGREPYTTQSRIKFGSTDAFVLTNYSGCAEHTSYSYRLELEPDRPAIAERAAMSLISGPRSPASTPFGARSESQTQSHTAYCAMESRFICQLSLIHHFTRHAMREDVPPRDRPPRR